MNSKKEKSSKGLYQGANTYSSAKVLTVSKYSDTKKYIYYLLMRPHPKDKSVQ